MARFRFLLVVLVLVVGGIGLTWGYAYGSELRTDLDSWGTEISLDYTVGTNPTTCATTDTIDVPPGTSVIYCYTVTNNTAMTLAMHTLTDSSQGPVFNDVRYALAPGTSFTYSTTTTLLTTTISTAQWDVLIPLTYQIFTDTCTTFPDVSTTGTPLNLSDDGSATVTLPFDFPFYDIETNLIRVNNNGAILLGDALTNVPTENTELPTATFDHAILPFWDDLDDETGNVYAGTYTYTFASGMTDSLFAPEGVTMNSSIQYYVVEWVNRSHFPGPNTSTATFATAILYPGQGLDGYGFTCYADTFFNNPKTNNGSSATVGLNQYSTGAEQYSANENRPELNELFALRYLPTEAGQFYTSTDATTVNVVYSDMTVDPTLIDETHNPAPQSTSRDLTIGNSGNSDLDWIITEAFGNCGFPANVSWLSVNVSDGSTLPNDNDTIAVRFNSTGLSDASYAARLCIRSNDYNTPLIEVPVNLVVQGSPITPTPTTPPTFTPTATSTPTLPLTDKLYLPLVKRQ